AGAVRHVIFLFLVAGLIALLLNPLVRGITRFWIPRGLGVATVYLLFAGLVGAVSIALGTVVVDQTRSASHRVDAYLTTEHGQPPQTHAERDIDRLQVWLNHHGLRRIKIRKQLNDSVDNIRTKDVQKYTTRVIDFVEGAAIGTVGLGPGLTKYAVLFGAWVAFTELIPYLGPWLGAVPPFVYELIVHPISALWVALLFLFIHQIEGHVVVPNVMGTALRLHPLLVIFGLLAGA